jgi:hypothetical protein
MPPRRAGADDAPAAAEPAGTSVSTYVMPDDIRRDLLNAQKGMIGEKQRLPQVKIMPAGAGLYEFTDTSETTREFIGVILGSHSRNVLWDKPFGSAPTNSDEPPLPACSSNDGQFGVPRQGFAHAALQRRGQAAPVQATGTERINCRTCPYNQWGSKKLIPALLRAGEDPEKVKGKATVNQRAVYLLVAGRETPVELVLPPTSLNPYDEYLASMLNQGVPVQGILTRIAQEVQTRGQTRWGVATFSAGEALDAAAFDRVMSARGQWRNEIDGIVEELVEAEPEMVDARAEAEAAAAAAAESGEEPLPF